MGNHFIHYFKIRLGIESSDTQTTEAEQAVIKRYATGKKNAVEIGVFEGFNTVLIANALDRNGKVYGIDPFTRGRMGLSYCKMITQYWLHKNKVSEKVNLVEKLSFDAPDDVPEIVDFVFIDGDHSYGGIEKDWTIFSKKVSPKGHIALHDTTAPPFQLWKSNMGSVQFFNDRIRHDSRFALVETVDSLNVLQRL